ncbi:MAG: hypothetical protein KF832_28005 [Caldilineaceae bacterium]|nr:hypothetical protein [Caldilineaceae bacterium]
MFSPNFISRICLSLALAMILVMPVSAQRDNAQPYQLFLPIISNATEVSQEQTGIEIDLDAISVGDVLDVDGIAISADDNNQDQCLFPQNITIRTAAPIDNVTKWASILFNDDCNAIITSKWKDNSTNNQTIFSTGQDNIVIKIQPTSADELWSDEIVAASPNISFETNEQYIITYGYPGAYDELTRHTERMTYTYDGKKAQISALGAYCNAATWPPGYDWVTDRCTIIGKNTGPSSIVSGSTSSSYHCDSPQAFPCNISNPDGYYHTLNSTIQGNNNGLSTCTFSMSGQIVRGPNRYLIQGCK